MALYKKQLLIPSKKVEMLQQVHDGMVAKP